MHKTYTGIVSANKKGILKEPFSPKDVVKACPNINSNTPGTFLPKHRVGNPSETSELFIRVSQGSYKLVRPFKYGL